MLTSSPFKFAHVCLQSLCTNLGMNSHAINHFSSLTIICGIIVCFHWYNVSIMAKT